MTKKAAVQFGSISLEFRLLAVRARIVSVSKVSLFYFRNGVDSYVFDRENPNYYTNDVVISVLHQETDMLCTCETV